MSGGREGGWACLFISVSPGGFFFFFFVSGGVCIGRGRRGEGGGRLPWGGFLLGFFLVGGGFIFCVLGARDAELRRAAGRPGDLSAWWRRSSIAGGVGLLARRPSPHAGRGTMMADAIKSWRQPPGSW